MGQQPVLVLMERPCTIILAYLIIVVSTGCSVVRIGVLLSVLLLVAVLLAAIASVAVLGGCGRRDGCSRGGVAGAVVVGVVGVGVEVARVRGRRQAQGGCKEGETGLENSTTEIVT